jgi:hypothetical protein
MNNRIRRIARSAQSIAGVAVLLIALLASCQNPVDGPKTATSGTVTITLAGAGSAARSIMPSAPDFSRYALTLQKGETTQTPDAGGLAVDGVTVQLEPGTWSVTVDAFQELDHDGDAETATQEYKAATATASLTVEAEGSNSVAVQLEPLTGDDAPQGVFAWDITLPEDVDTAAMSLGTVPALTDLDLTLNANGSAEVAGGVYNLTILLSKDGLSTSLIEKVYIYGGLQTTAALDLSDLVFGDEVLIAGTLTITGNGVPESGYVVNAYASEAGANSESSPIATALISSMSGDSGAFLLAIPVSDYNALGAGTSSGKKVYIRATHPSVEIRENSVVTVDNLPVSGATGKNVGITVASTYTVSYNANGGSGTVPASQTVNEGSSVTVADQGDLTLSGYGFAGWNTSVSGSGTSYSAGSSLTVNADTTLYAQWVPIDPEGVYIGLISFAGNAADLTGGAPILLDASGRESLRYYLNNSYTIASQPGTALFYGVHRALANLKSNESHYPVNLDSVNVITFTDGLDISSDGRSAFNPIENEIFDTADDYADYVSLEIANRSIASKSITAYSVGVRGGDVTDIQGFQNNLAAIASPGKSNELTDFNEVQATFDSIAEGLNITHTNTSFTMVTALLSSNVKVRMTFDVTGTDHPSAAGSARYIEGVINRTGTTYTFTDIVYSGGLGSVQGSGPITGTVVNEEVVHFVFDGIESYDSDTDIPNTKQWLWSTSTSQWQINSEYSSAGSSYSTVERRSSVIYLILDASTSLSTDQIGLIRDASIGFIDSLYEQLNP